MQAEPSVLPMPRADVEAQVQAAVCQPGQPRPSSPIKGEIEVESIGSFVAEHLCSGHNCHIGVNVIYLLFFVSIESMLRGPKSDICC